METILNKESRAAIELMIADGIIAKDTAERYFPELKESEDERIRKDIISHFAKGIEGSSFDEVREKYKIWIAWLEKQGERKPADKTKKCMYSKDDYTDEDRLVLCDGCDEICELKQKPAWSEEDEMFVHGLIRGLTAKRDIHGHTTFGSDSIDITETINWLKSLKDRALLYPVSVECNEEDIDNIVDTFIPEPVWYALEESEGEGSNAAAYDYSQMIAMFKAGVHWLKSLRPHNIWKPSDEQMEALDDFIYAKYPNIEKYEASVKSLYQDLKKLRGE